MLVNPGQGLLLFVRYSDERRSLFISCGAHTQCIRLTSTMLPMTDQMCVVHMLQGGVMRQSWLIATGSDPTRKLLHTSAGGKSWESPTNDYECRVFITTYLMNEAAKQNPCCCSPIFKICYSQNHSSLRNALTLVLPK